MGPREDRALRNLRLVRREWCRAQRLRFRPFLMPEYRQRYDALALRLHGTFWAPVSGTRSFEEQQDAWASGRTSPGPIHTVERQGDHPANWGCSTSWAEFDIEYEGRGPWEMADWAFLEDCSIKSGLRFRPASPMGEDPRVELPISKPWRFIGDTYRLEGTEAAVRDIRRLMEPWGVPIT